MGPRTGGRERDVQKNDTVWAHDRECGLQGLVPERGRGQSVRSENSNEGNVGTDTQLRTPHRPGCSARLLCFPRIFFFFFKRRTHTPYCLISSFLSGRTLSLAPSSPLRWSDLSHERSRGHG